jgi:hypothetical protein
VSSEHSIKAIFVWLGGAILAALIAFYVVGYAIDHWIVPNGADDALIRESGGEAG